MPKRSGRGAYSLESLEPRVLLSANGLLDEALAVVWCSDDASVALEAYVVDESTNVADQSFFRYDAAQTLDDLFPVSEVRLEPAAEPGPAVIPWVDAQGGPIQALNTSEDVLARTDERSSTNLSVSYSPVDGSDYSTIGYTVSVTSFREVTGSAEERV